MSDMIKKQYNDCVYKILETEGLQAISIRRIAKEVGCNSATLYRYFNDVEQLICLTSIRYLEPYLKDIREASKTIRNPIELNQSLWKSFATYAFHRPTIFEMLFFGQYKENLMDFMYEYYDIYMDDFLDLDGFSITFLFNGSIFERNYMFYRRAVGMGYITQDAAKLISEVEVYTFHGLLMECKQNQYSTEELNQKVLVFRQQMDQIIEKFILK